MWRAHRADRGPWWFSDRGTGRFDLTDGRGTCHAGDDVETAVREALGPLASGGKTVTRSVAAALMVSAIPVPDGVYANVSARGAVRHGFHRELVTTIDYRITQSWAAAFDAAGFDGVRYASRFTSEPGPNAWAVFGPSGSGDHPIGARVDGLTACATAGVPVAPMPGPKRSFRLRTDA